MSTSREIMKILVVEKRCPERMGLYEHFWGDTFEQWTQYGGYPAGADPADIFGYDMREIGGWFNTEALFLEKKTILEETDETIVGTNGWGATMRNWKHKSGTPEHLAFEMTTDEVWRKKYREPLLSLDVKRFGDLDEMRRVHKQRMAEDKFCAYSNVTIFEIMRASMGDVAMLENMYMDPDWIRDFCDVVTNHLIMHYEYLFREVGLPDGMFIYEDMGYTRSPFISPDMQRELIFPFHKRLADFFHEYKLPFIMHSCGKIRSFLPAIYEAGIDCLQVLEAKADQHVVEFAESVNNKMAFMGNLNIQAFETNNKAAIDAEIIPKLKSIKEKRIPFIFHSDHSIPKTVTFETYNYALELYRKYGRY